MRGVAVGLVLSVGGKAETGGKVHKEPLFTVWMQPLEQRTFLASCSDKRQSVCLQYPPEKYIIACACGVYYLGIQSRGWVILLGQNLQRGR